MQSDRARGRTSQLSTASTVKTKGSCPSANSVRSLCGATGVHNAARNERDEPAAYTCPLSRQHAYRRRVNGPLPAGGSLVAGLPRATQAGEACLASCREGYQGTRSRMQKSRPLRLQSCAHRGEHAQAGDAVGKLPRQVLAAQFPARVLIHSTDGSQKNAGESGRTCVLCCRCSEGRPRHQAQCR